MVLRLAKRKADDILVKKLVYADLLYGLEAFDTYDDLLEFVRSIDPNIADTRVSIVAKYDVEEFCNSLKKVINLLKGTVAVEVPEVCKEG